MLRFLRIYPIDSGVPVAMEQLPTPIEREAKPVSIAVLSGKGGSGKTLIALSLLRALQGTEGSLLLVDADPGTGGLSYFLSVNYIRGQGAGLVGLLLEGIESEAGGVHQRAESFEFKADGEQTEAARTRDQSNFASTAHDWIPPTSSAREVIRALKGFDECYVLPIGDIQRFIRTPASAYRSRVRPVVAAIIQLEHRVKIFDCRGGIDAFTVEICRQVDFILVVTETDVASVQSTRNVLEILKEVGLGYRVSGFCINRLFDDASNYNMIMRGLFEVQFLGGIPFDIESMRRFLVGRVPKVDSPFAANVANVAAALFGSNTGVKVHVKGPVYQGQDFARLSLRDPREIGGQALGASIIAALSITALASIYISLNELEVVIVDLNGTAEELRRATGQLLYSIERTIETSKEYLAGAMVESGGVQPDGREEIIKTWDLMGEQLDDVSNRGWEERLSAIINWMEEEIGSVVYRAAAVIGAVGVLGLIVSFEAGRRLLGKALEAITFPFRRYRKGYSDQVDD